VAVNPAVAALGQVIESRHGLSPALREQQSRCPVSSPLLNVTLASWCAARVFSMNGEAPPEPGERLDHLMTGMMAEYGRAAPHWPDFPAPRQVIREAVQAAATSAVWHGRNPGWIAVSAAQRALQLCRQAAREAALWLPLPPSPLPPPPSRAPRPHVPLDPEILRQMFRHLQRFEALFENEGIHELADPGTGEVYSLADLLHLYQARRRLPPRQEQAVRLLLYEDMTEKEAASVMGLSRDTPVTVYATKGLRKLCTYYETGVFPGPGEGE
jgi:DNA-directed RNA polymerase specialized sigma24 family protein